MDALISALSVAALLAAGSVHANTVTRWRSLITEASARIKVPAAWIERVMSAESGGQTMLNGHRITSDAGAMGLMQLMPATWRDMRRRLGLGHDPYDPHDNILAGTLYLRLMYERFGYPGLFAAYNAGPARYAAHLASGRPLPDETQRYVYSVTSKAPELTRVAHSIVATSLFFSSHAVFSSLIEDKGDKISLFAIRNDNKTPGHQEN